MVSELLKQFVYFLEGLKLLFDALCLSICGDLKAESQGDHVESIGILLIAKAFQVLE